MLARTAKKLFVMQNKTKSTAAAKTRTWPVKQQTKEKQKKKI